MHRTPPNGVAPSHPELLHEDLTRTVIEAFRQVHYELGAGFVESVYLRALEIALRQSGLRVRRELPITVFFRGEPVGLFRGDLLVESKLLLELKIGDRLDPAAETQLLNYLRATRIEVGLILHFGPKPKVKRRILTNDRKLVR